MESIKKEVIQVIFLATANFALQYLSHLYMANLLTPSDYGAFAVSISIITLLSMVVELGASKSLPKYVHLYQKNEDFSHISGLLRMHLKLVIGISFLIIAVGNALTYFQPDLAYKTDNPLYQPLVLILWAIPFITMSNILATLLKCIHLNIIFNLPRSALFGLVILFLWIGDRAGVKETGVLGAIVFNCAAIFIFFIYICMALHYVPQPYYKSTPQYDWKKWFAMSLPMMASNLLFLGMAQMDLIMVKVLSTDPSNVGYYSAANQTARVIIYFYTTLNLLFIPLISQSMLHGNVAIKKLLLKMSVLMVGICLAFLSIMLFFGKRILISFGDGYTAAYPAMMLLAIGLSVNAIVGGHLTYLQYSIKYKLVLGIQFMTLLFSVLLNAWLIPQFGLLGAGLSSAISLTAMSVILTWIAVRLLNR